MAKRLDSLFTIKELRDELSKIIKNNPKCKDLEILYTRRILNNYIKCMRLKK